MEQEINLLIRKTNTYLSNLRNQYIQLINYIQKLRIRNKPYIINYYVQMYYKLVTNAKTKLNTQIEQIKLKYNQTQTSISNQTPETIQNNKYKTKRAILIGINYYGTPYELNGCIDDENRIKNFLTELGYNEFIILNDLPETEPALFANKKNILENIKKAIQQTGENDILTIYYSGHGSSTYDYNGDEFDGKDEMIVSCDLQAILDDELNNILVTETKPGSTIFGIYDSCHSGSIMDLKYRLLDTNNNNKTTINNKVKNINGTVYTISGCMDSQTSSEAIINNKPEGAVSWAFMKCFKENEQTWSELISSMRELLKTNSFTQIPQLESNIELNVNTKINI